MFENHKIRFDTVQTNGTHHLAGRARHASLARVLFHNSIPFAHQSTFLLLHIMDPASQVSNLLDRGQFDSVRQAARTTDVPRSTIQDRQAGIQPRGRESQRHARLTRDQEDSLAAYIKDLQLQYAPVNQT